ncbi:MAG: saccharopine dehydrogenase NADP-binding domain-containing protein [Robiginitomaculum sp.]|nr:saccharopine dehydrogenase NADP-binding domain-containing protein [Robiginitomaculum sp.]
MAKFLVLGAGLVVAPLVEYLCRRVDNTIVIANNILAAAQDLAAPFKNASAELIDVTDAQALQNRAADFDLVLSMVPPTFHPLVAKACIGAKTHMVSASYQSGEMLALSAQAEAASITILNEIGLDPGIDHLSAMQIIDAAHAKGEQIEAFVSWCGGLPAPDDNDNPLGYKFSWNPKGAILVLLNEARYKQAGKNKIIASENLMNWAKPVRIGGLDLECYPNRNSLLYKDIYNIPEVNTLIRGTLRYPGFCAVMQLAKTLGLFGLENVSVSNTTTWNEYISILNGGASVETLRDNAPDKPWQALDWLGVFSDNPIHAGLTPVDVFCDLLLAKLPYLDGEQDMIILQHKFIIKRKDGTKYYRSALFKSIGEPGGSSAMAVTVGLPAAMAAQLIVDGHITQTGMVLPVSANIYDPILRLLKQDNIEFSEQVWEQDQMNDVEFIPELHCI